MADWSAQNVILGKAFAKELLGAVATRPAAALVAAGKLRLGKDPGVVPTSDTALADLSAGEADFTGYTSGGDAVTFSAAVNISDTGVALLFDDTFVAGTATPQVANNLWYWWIDDGTRMVCAERFPAAIPITLPGDFLNLLAEVVLALSAAGG